MEPMESATEKVKSGHRVSSKAVRVTKGFNKAKGAASAKTLAFCDTHWGEVTRGYMKSISGLGDTARDKIIRKAVPFVVKKGRSAGSTAHPPSNTDTFEEEDARATLVNLSDVESDHQPDADDNRNVDDGDTNDNHHSTNDNDGASNDDDDDMY